MVIVMYGTAINDALADPQTTVEHLVTLRDHARAILEQQGDLQGALEKLEAELRRRNPEAGY